MNVRTVLSEAKLRKIAKDLDCFLSDFQRHGINNYNFKFRVMPGNNSYRCHNPITGRNSGSQIPCWHGYRDFMVSIYDADPDAKITSGWGFRVTYHNAQDFAENHGETAYTAMGSQIYPYQYLDKCNH